MRSVFYFYKMHHFIKNVIEKIFSDKTRNISNSIIILPNKRSKVFLKKEISNVAKKTIFAPKIYDIEDCKDYSIVLCADLFYFPTKKINDKSLIQIKLLKNTLLPHNFIFI